MGCDCPNTSTVVGAPNSISSFSDFVPDQPALPIDVIIRGTVEIQTIIPIIHSIFPPVPMFAWMLEPK